ncbi:MAG TPA: hypothetical protein H9680_04580 [Firmicutes bacterium]|nr:hypothetical protein [Bacillota bacterium]
MKATICNEAHPEYGDVSLPFPIKLEEYDENLKMLDALGIGDPIEQDCFVDEIESPHLILERLKGNRINLDELDFLAKQLNRFSEREMVDFEGSVLLQKATELPELINIALSCSNTIIHQRFRELAHIGQKILAAQNDRDVTFGQAESATPVQAALDALSHGAGTVTPYGVVFENGMGIRLQYDGQVFPDCDCESPLAVIQVPLKHEWELRQLFLPMPEKRLERELIRLGYEEGNAYWIFSSKGALFEKLESAPVWEAPETELQEPDGHEWTPPEPECVNLDAYAQEVLTLANAQREAAGLNPLSADPVLTEMAMLRARELEESYSHTRLSGENCKTVFGEFETDLRFWGENAAKGNRTPEAVVEAWMDSPGHRENLLREDAGYLGVGVWQDEDGILYWVQLFAIE